MCVNDTLRWFTFADELFCNLLHSLETQLQLYILQCAVFCNTCAYVHMSSFLVIMDPRII